MNAKKPQDQGKVRYIKFKNINILTDDDDDNFTEFVGNLNLVNTNNPDTILNETTISDNKGGRIILNEDDTQIVKK